MRIRVPGAVHRLWATNFGLPAANLPINGPWPRTTSMLGVSTPSERYVTDEDTYFWCTKHREMNDCVHSKRVYDGDVLLPPTLVSETGELFQSQVRGYYLRCTMESDPLRSVRQLFQALPSCHLLNYDEDSIYIQLNPLHGTMGPGNSGWFSIHLEINHAGVRNSKWRVFRLTQDLQFYYNVESSSTDYLHYTVLTPVFSGRKRVWGACATYVPDELMDTMLVALRGLRAYSNYAWDPVCGVISEGLLDATLDYALKARVLGRKSNYDGWNDLGPYKPSTALSIPELPRPDERFLFHEDELYVQGLDPYLVSAGRDTSNYFRNVLFQNAYLDALQSTPRLNDNSISNILEIAGFIKGLVVDHRIDIPKSLGDVWLSYRYQYMTSKLDAQEAIEFVHRHCDLGTLDQWVHCFGSHHIEFTRGRFSALVTCRCGLEIRPSDVAMLGKVWRALYTYGLQPNFYVVWDMIPYSFIIDWLIPVGSLAQVVDARSMYEGTYYEIKDIVFSLSYDIRDEYNNVYHQYTRVTHDGDLGLNGFYFLEEDPVSTKVKGMRVLDMLSLFIGGK